MQIAQVLPTTLIDYPGRVAALVYVPGCDFRCPFCHNPELVLPERVSSLALIPQERVLHMLRERRGFLDGVVITGGEATLQGDLADFARALKGMDLLVKLDTNGSRPDVLDLLLGERLLDYVAMDLKAPADRYDALCGTPVDLEAIHRSIRSIIARAPDYEFRTTAAPTLTPADLVAVTELIPGAKRFVLQRFVSPAGKDLVDPAWRDRPALTDGALRAVWNRIKGRFPDGGAR